MYVLPSETWISECLQKILYGHKRSKQRSLLFVLFVVSIVDNMTVHIFVTSFVFIRQCCFTENISFKNCIAFIVFIDDVITIIELQTSSIVFQFDNTIPFSFIGNFKSQRVIGSTTTSIAGRQHQIMERENQIILVVYLWHSHQEQIVRSLRKISKDHGRYQVSF